jgi:HEAT repeat protein
VIKERGGMSTSSSGAGTPIPASSGTEAKKSGPRRTGIRALIVLVIACGAILWAWRSIWDARHPLLAAAGRLRSPDASQRLAAIQEVTELGANAPEEAIGPLITALADQDAAVRRSAALALSSVVSVPAKAGTQPEAVKAAAQGLLETLKDPEPTVRVAAASALRILAGITPGTSRTGRSGAGKTAPVAASAPSVIDASAVTAALLDLLGDRDAEVRKAAIFALGPVAPKAFQEPPKALLAALDDESAANRAVAIGTLTAFPRGLDPIMPLLFKRMASDEPQVREACAQALGRIRPSALTPGVAAALLDGLKSRDREVRLRIVRLLTRISPDVATAVPALIAVLNEPIDSDQADMEGTTGNTTYSGPAHAAAAALGRLAPGTRAAGQAVAALAEVARSGAPQRQSSAAAALANFGKDAAPAVPALIAMLEAAEAGKEPTRDKASAAEALGRIAPSTSSADQAVAALTAALKSSSASTRAAVIRALPSFAPLSSQAIAQLRTLQESDPVPTVRKAAASALEELKAGSK